ncbi:MAG: HAMP domain-containing sensor histidine kinase, partial [Acidobacteria bacterium]|nr:HAMP domain-containing sensor histidine kinase [Acidobacteriota bacterium]
DRCALARENLSWRGFPGDANNLSGRGYSPEACAAALYEGLVDGRWRLEAPLYEFYAAQARSWLQPVMGRADIAELARREARKLALTNAAIAALRQWRATNPAGDEGHLVVGASPAPVLAVWRRFNGDGGGDDMSMLVLGPATLATRVWQSLVARSAPGYAVSIAANRLGLLTSTAADADAAPDAANASAGPEVHGASAHTDVATLTVEDGGIVWRVTARADAAHDPRQAVAVRTRLYLGTLAVMLVAVALAGYLAIRTVRRELEVARLKSEFVSAVSHEFRSPLAAISHLSELLDAGRVPDDERRREYYGLIVNETARLRRLVENLLDFARLEEGRAEFQFDAMDVEPWLRDAVDEFQASRAAAGMQVETAVHEGLPAVRADAEALTTVVVNLLDNAVKYSPGCERVWVEAGPAHGGAEIRVRDAGPGIPEDEQPHVFDRFFRGRDAGAVSGTGLGLALVARTVEAHGGRVSVESRLGEGSTFVVWLPAWREEQA